MLTVLPSEGTYMCDGGEYPGLLCPLVSRWSSEPLSSSWADCIRVGGLPLSIPGGLPPSSPGGLPPNSPGGLPPIRPDASPPRRPWQLPPIGPVQPLFMRPGVPSKGREVSARAACRRGGERGEMMRIPIERELKGWKCVKMSLCVKDWKQVKYAGREARHKEEWERKKWQGRKWDLEL